MGRPERRSASKAPRRIRKKVSGTVDALVRTAARRGARKDW